MSFKLKSGNKPPFKIIGASPVKSNGETHKERVTKENKRLKEVYEQDKKSYSDSTASYENRIKAYDLLKGKKFNEKNAQKSLDEFNKLKQENKERGVYFDFRIAHIKPPGQKLSWFNQNKEKLLYIGDRSTDYGSRPTGVWDDLTKEDIAKQLKPKKKPVKPKYRKTITNAPPLKPITPSLVDKSKSPAVPKPKKVLPLNLAKHIGKNGELKFGPTLKGRSNRDVSKDGSHNLQIQKVNGRDGKRNVISTKQLNQYIKDGLIEIYHDKNQKKYRVVR